MNKEVREQAWEDFLIDVRWSYPDGSHCYSPSELADKLSSLGYRLIPELTVISDGDMKKVIKDNINLLNDEKKAPELLFKVAQAQRDKDANTIDQLKG